MAKPGPKTFVELSDLHAIFEDRANEILCDDGKIRAPSDRIWSTLKRQKKIAKSEKAIYNDCWRWNNTRQYRKDPCLNISGDSDVFEEELNSSLNELSLNDSDYENDEIRDAEPIIKFLVKLSSDVWTTCAKNI